MEQLANQISGVDSGWKIAAFALWVLLSLFQLLLNKNSRILPKYIMVLLITVVFLIFITPVIADVIKSKIEADRPRGDTSYKITITVLNQDGFPYTNEQATVIVNNVDARANYSEASRSWQFKIDTSELPAGRRMTIFAASKDQKYNAKIDTFLSSELNQAFVLSLKRGPEPGPGGDTVRRSHSFSINSPDESLRKEIEQRTGARYNPISADTRIVIGYDSNSIVYRGGSDTYIFTRSNPVLFINGVSITLDNCFIPESAPSHEKQNIRNYGRTQSMDIATAFLKQNPSILATWIKRSH